MDTYVKQLINDMLQAVDFEREEERARHDLEMKTLTGDAREKKGRAVMYLKKKFLGKDMTGGYLYNFKKGEKIITEMSVGDQVIVSQNKPLLPGNPTGLIYELHNTHMVIAFTKKMTLSNAGGLRVDLAVNDTTYRRMEENLLKIKSPEYSKLHHILSGKYKVTTANKGRDTKTLNTVQNQGVHLAYNNNGFYTIQGPPGTGKTYMASHLVKALVDSDKKVLITADSNGAVDHLMRHCINMGLDPLRIGNPIRVNHDLKSYTLDYRVYRHVLYKDILALETAIAKTKDVQKDVKRPDAKDTRGYDYTELMGLISRRESGRGISKDQLKSMKPFLKLQKKIDESFDQIQMLKTAIQGELIDKHKVIACTNATSGCDLLEDIFFDFLVMDEAAQASFPSAIIPISKVNRFVLIGDHFQLPPVVLNQEAKTLGLDTSLMDRLAKAYPYFLTRLNVSYRMHQDINDLVSTMFYKDQLLAHHSVAKRRVLGGPVITCHSVKGQEMIQKDSKSFYNDEEIRRVEELSKDLLAQGIKKDQIAVISPYKGQVRKMRPLLEGLEVDTVDAFQGREKDVVILSFVRSNPSNTLGFLKDFRRLNVSISRAKSRLILIGNFDVLRTNDMFDYMYAYIEDLYRS